LTKTQIAELETLLSYPSLSDAIYRFCNHIIENYSFSEVLEGALKRAVWHHVSPEFAKSEIEALGEPFRKGALSYFKSSSPSENMSIPPLADLRRRIAGIADKFV
jgi:hypothetical protein